MRVEWELPHTLPEIRVPQLILQPLLENAVYHGIQPVVEQGSIKVSLIQAAKGWLLEISNSKSSESIETGGNRIAHQNIRARLEAHFGDGATLNVEDQGNRYEAQILIPMNEDKV